jgi:hypothetical protein
MPIAIVEGEVQLGADGVLQGWCWNPKRPAERLVLEILIDDNVVSTFVASRFREDLRERGISDGYYGFIATLPKSLLDAGHKFVISARERASGCCFWQQVRGEPSLPEEFPDRFAAAQHRISRVAQSKHFRELGTTSSASRIAKEMRNLGAHLLSSAQAGRHQISPIINARAAILRHTAQVSLDVFRNPKLSIILIADSTCNHMLSAISAVVPHLTTIEASLLLIDCGTHDYIALAPSLFGDLRYIFDPRNDLASLLTNGLKYTGGDLLVFIRNPGKNIAQGLRTIVSHMNDANSVYINSRNAEIAFGICAESSQNVPKRSVRVPVGLDFAGPRSLFERLRGRLELHDCITGAQDVDLAIQAIREGIEICLWDESTFEQEPDLHAEATH